MIELPYTKSGGKRGEGAIDRGRIDRRAARKRKFSSLPGTQRRLRGDAARSHCTAFAALPP